jgi:sterol desaturase/sphingolipid hydroxylase (fatty acid hydroxylase superfamily)
MDDLQFGTRNKRGDWAPSQRLVHAPWTWPPEPARIARWIGGYVWPWNLLFLLSALAWWAFVVPDAATMRALSAGWPLRLLAANEAGILLFFGAFELRYYVRRVQGQRFKFNGKFPSDQRSNVFWFERQDIDNFLRCLLIGIPFGTAIEVLLLWAFANGSAPQVSWDGHAAWIVLLVLLVPLVHELHFFVIHRALHLGPLYRWVHSVHHNSVNPSPWSSLAMHPVELFLYFGVAFWALAVPSHPFLVVYFFHLAGFGAVVGHIGFDKLEITERTAQDSHAYAHYLHHKHFDVNYCDNGVLPLDVWFGTWHDGSADGERRMQERFRRKRERLNARSGAS